MELQQKTTRIAILKLKYVVFKEKFTIVFKILHELS
jgi:hypothetical protein